MRSSSEHIHIKHNKMGVSTRPENTQYFIILKVFSQLDVLLED